MGWSEMGSRREQDGRHRVFSLRIGALGLAAVIVSGTAAMGAGRDAEELPPSHKLPWELRERYTFTLGKGVFSYAADSGEWKLDVEGLGTVIASGRSQVVLADGAWIDPLDVGNGSGTIQRLTSPFGEGATYAVASPSQNGLTLNHTIRLQNIWPFLLLSVQVTNNRSEPVAVSRIDSARFVFENLSPTAQVGQRMLKARGPCFVPGTGPGSLLAVIEDRQNDFTFAIGPLPQGIAESADLVSSHEGRWQVQVVSTFDPPFRLGPGESVESDPVWITYSIPRPVDVDHYYAWANSLLQQTRAGTETPASWVTVPVGSSAEDLYEAATAWKQTGVRHTLVPAAWETKPGSLSGARPSYPRNMGEVAATLRGMGMTPGLTIDPLAVQGGDPAWVVRSASGQSWLNPAVPEARQYAAERLRNLVRWGFAFFVVEPSLIPEEVLAHFNLTRRRADTYAFELMAEAAPGLTVLPTPERSLAANLDAWLDAAGATSRLREYGVLCGPVRLDATNVKELDPPLLTALAFYGGPIEFVGHPRQGFREAVAAARRAGSLGARPLTIGGSPKLWHVVLNSSQGDDPREGVVMFPGAPSWSLAEIGLGQQTAIWQTEKGEFLRMLSNPVAGGDDFRLVRLVTDFARPVVLGVPDSPLPFGDFTRLKWEESSATLTGQYAGGTAGTVYVAVPRGWTLKSGQAGPQSVRKNSAQGLVSFPVEGGRPTHFDLTFKRTKEP